MKIYTYYENIEHNNKHLQHKNQQEMLRLWQISWQNAGFEPIVLSLKDVQKNTFYSEFIQQMKRIHLMVMGKKISDYGLSCYVRWLAYATQKEEYFYVSDYDCINNGLKPKIQTDKMHLMDGACPCFVSGSPARFETLCHLFVDVSLQRIKHIILKTQKNKQVWYHDQEFCLLNLTHENNLKASEIKEANNIIMTRDRVSGVGPFDPDKNNTLKVLHISHHNAYNIKTTKKDFENISIDEIRIHIMKQIISQKSVEGVL